MNVMYRNRGRASSVVFMAAALLLAACAKSTTPSSGATTTSPATAGAVTIDTGSVSGVGTVLVDAKGFTLYHLKTETPGKIVCTGSCRGLWPPVLLPAGASSAMAGMGLNSLGTITRPDGGTQVTYKNMPLYRYSGDSAAGQANGQGIENVWFAVTTSGSAPVPSASKSSGGYGY